MDQNKFGFQPDISKLDSYMKENEKNFSGENQGPTWWQIPAGMSSVRVLPPWDPTGRIALAVYSHPIEFQGKDMRYKKYSWTCVNKTFGKPCNICQGLDSIREAGVDVSNYEPNRRTFYLNAIVIYDPDYDRDLKAGKKPEECGGTAPGTHVLMRAPKTVYDWIVSNITNPMVGDITSITNGIDIIITREGTGLGTTYTTTLSPNGRQPIPQEYLDKIDNLYNLDEVFSVGFEQEQINELVESLRRSSGAMSAGIPNMASQMSGQYQQPPQMGIPPQGMAPQMGTPPVTPFQQPPTNNFGVPNTTPFNNPGMPSPTTNMTPPWESNNQAPAVPTQQTTPDTPNCFGTGYNASNVKCVTCAWEIDCANRSNK